MAWCWLIVLLGTAGAAPAKEQQPLPETAVLSAYLVNFLHFVEWPETAFASAESPYLLCLLGPEDLFKTLETMAEGQVRRGRGLTAKLLEDVSGIDGCHVLYVDPKAWPDLEETFEGMRQEPLLIVGRQRDFLDQGGGINLVPKDGRLRFEVDRDALEGCGLKIDSRLLDAALNVRQSKRRRRRQP